MIKIKRILIEEKSEVFTANVNFDVMEKIDGGLITLVSGHIKYTTSDETQLNYLFLKALIKARLELALEKAA